MEERNVDAAALAERVRRARMQRDLNQTQLARAAGVSQSTVSRIEKGDREVTLVEADALARALELPLDTLLHGSGVQERVLVALRTATRGVDRGAAIGPGVELLEFDERLDTVEPAFRQQPRPAPVTPPPSGAPSTQGARLAATLREALQLGEGPIAELPELIEEVTGVDVASRPLVGTSGMCLDDPQRQTRLLLVNSNETAERQRFTLAHELGHLLFGDGAHVEGLDGEDREVETRCNEFARNFLAPQQGIEGWLARNVNAGQMSDQVVSLLARYFGVSTEVVKIQLERMGRRAAEPVQSTPVSAARYGWRAEYDAAQVSAHRPRPPRRLAQRAASAYARGLVGAAAVAKLDGRAVADVEAELAELRVATAPQTRTGGRVSVDSLLARAAARQQ